MICTLAPQAEGSDKANDLPVPLVLADLSGKSNFGLDLLIAGFSAGDASGSFDFTGMDMLLKARNGGENTSFGIVLPLAFAIPEEGDSAFWMGNPTVDATGVWCLSSLMGLCLGGQLSASFGFLDLDQDDTVNRVKQLAANAAGFIASQNLLYHALFDVVIQPLFVASIRIGFISAQVEMGPLFAIPLINTSGRSMEELFIYRFGAALNLLDFIQPMIEYSGLSELSDSPDVDDSLGWINIGARVNLFGFQPMFRLTLPINEDSKLGADVQFALGMTYQY